MPVGEGPKLRRGQFLHGRLNNVSRDQQFRRDIVDASFLFVVRPENVGKRFTDDRGHAQEQMAEFMGKREPLTRLRQGVHLPRVKDRTRKSTSQLAWSTSRSGMAPSAGSATRDGTGLERPGIQPDPVVDVRLPTDWLLVKGLPTHEDVKGRLSRAIVCVSRRWSRRSPSCRPCARKRTRGDCSAGVKPAGAFTSPTPCRSLALPTPSRSRDELASRNAPVPGGFRVAVLPCQVFLISSSSQLVKVRNRGQRAATILGSINASSLLACLILAYAPFCVFSVAFFSLA